MARVVVDATAVAAGSDVMTEGEEGDVGNEHGSGDKLNSCSFGP